MADKPQFKIFVIVVITLVALAIVALSLSTKNALPLATSPLGRVLNPIVRLGQTVSHTVGGWLSSIAESDAIRRENITLKDEIARLKNELATTRDAAKQFDALKAAFGLRSLFPDMNARGGYIMNRALGIWYDVYRINVGRHDGVTVTSDRSYAVVDANANLVGRVLSSDAVSSKVLPILHESFAAGARLQGGSGVTLRVRGDVEAKRDDRLIADNIPLDAAVGVGDRIVTSGAGGVFPEGLPIGTIESLAIASDKKSLTAVVKPLANFDTLSAVFVLTPKTR